MRRAAGSLFSGKNRFNKHVSRVLKERKSLSKKLA